jgi:TetR/AcrR family transcriptional repressor of nem operon
MARPKEFDRATALNQAVMVFSSHGYEGTSTEALLAAMGISRQSMYDTFGDKRRLYLEALAHYTTASVGEIVGSMRAEASPLQRLEAALLGFASRPATTARSGCMGVMAICEFGRSDEEVSALSAASARALRSAFARLIDAARAAGEVDASIDPAAGAEFLHAVLSGIKVAGRGGASRETLRNIAQMAVRSLR